MIHVEISNIWGQLSLPQLLSVETELSAAHMELCNTENAHTPWLTLPDLPFTLEEHSRLTSSHSLRVHSNSTAPQAWHRP